MRLDLSQLQKVKMGVHTIQAILIFVAACLTIAVLVKDGDTDSRTAWFFGLVLGRHRHARLLGCSRLTVIPVFLVYSSLDIPGSRANVVTNAQACEGLCIFRTRRCLHSEGTLVLHKSTTWLFILVPYLHGSRYFGFRHGHRYCPGRTRE